MLEMSEDTIKKLESLFPEHLQEEAKHLLIHECGNNISDYKNEVERIRLAALKVSGGILKNYEMLLF